jgi:hypothetical protein
MTLYTMTLYMLARILKFLALFTYVGASAASWTATSLHERRRAVHNIASPALLAVWLAGYTLAWLRGTSPFELWMLGGLLLSLGANLGLIHAAASGVRTPWTVARYALPLGLTIVLMVLRPQWSWLDA